jgi:carbonic anhydrase
MLKKLTFLLLFLIACSLIAYSSEEGSVTKDEACSMLKEGNNRFVTGERTFTHLDEDRIKETEKGQHPFAIVLTCSDSRVPAEHIFDAGIGDIFTIRVAGNVFDTDEIGTAEYGVAHLKSPVILVLGHSNCGAVTAVATGAELEGSLPGLLDNVKPALERTKVKDPTLKGDDLINKCIEENVWVSIEDLFNRSEIVREYVKEGKLLVIGAIYNLETGKINWIGQHPEEKKLTEKHE